MPPNMIYPWKRYWVKQGENPTMESGLFQEPLSAIRWFSPASNGVALSELKDCPCLVLLGDVGMGKSTTLQTEASELKVALAGQKHAVAYVDLKRLSETHIERRIFKHAEVESWLRGDHSLTLFLDSLDECWRRIDALELLLVDEFKRRIHKDTPPLFLRLTCRSAEWRGDTGKTLEQLFSKRADSNPPVQIFVLAPLSANNVKDAAKANDLDGDRLLERITVKEAQGLASHPITLEMLLQIFKESGDFPKSRVDLYRAGCLRLCTDEYAVFNSAQKRKTTPEHRFAIASRLAALSVFSNRFLINGDVEHPLSREDALEVTEIVGHTDEKAGGESVTVNRDTIAETLQTALFTERIDGAQTWRHQSYAEFLAAQYVSHRGLSPAQIVALLTDTADNSKRIVPQLEEAACWTAEIIPEVFENLTTHNADIFLRCDPTYWNGRHRTLLVEHYLRLVRCHEAAELDWQLKYRFARLAHSDLVDQLKPIITNRVENPLVRESAIEIAGHCKLDSLAPELIEVFLDSVDVFRVRKHASFAVAQVATNEVRKLLKSKNVGDWAGDINDDLKGEYLRILWPSHLGLDDILPLTPPKQLNYTGSYKIFLQHDLPNSLKDSDLSRMLDWLRENNVNFDILGVFGHLPSKLFSNALAMMNILAVRDAVLRLLSIDEHQIHYLFRGEVGDQNLSVKERVDFWKAVVQSDLDIRKLIVYGDLPSCRVLSREDALAFIAEYRVSVGERLRNRWRELVFRAFSIDDPDALDALSELAQSDEAISEALAARTSCPILPDDQNWMKRNYIHQERNRVKQEVNPPLAEMVERALVQFEKGNIEAYWRLFELLDRDPENIQRFVFNIRFSEQKAWKSLTADVRRRILAGAPTYLRAQAVEETEVWNTEQRFRPYDILNQLLVLLFDENRQTLNELTGEDWKKWISVFLTYSSRRNGNHDEAYKAILALAFSKAQQPFLAALKRYLEAEINNDSERRIIWHLSAVWSDEIKEVLLDLFRNKPLKKNAAQNILQILAIQEPKETEPMLVSIVGEIDGAKECNIHAPVAVVILLTNFPTTWSAPLLNRIRDNPALGRAVVPRLVRGNRQPSDWLSEIPPMHIAIFWEWLNEHFPGDPYEKDEHGGVITIDHDIYDFRNGVFYTLTRLGTIEACDAMVELMRKRPNDFWLGNILAEMRKTTHRKAWKCPSPLALMLSFATADRRLIRTAGELHGLIIESLGRFESELHGIPPSMELWNESNKGKDKFRQPKDEMNLSNCLKRFLERDLKERGVIADREVEIRPKLGKDPAQLVDILVRAVPFGEDGQQAHPVSVVIEVKCAWNTGVLQDMKLQLFDRYLNNSEMHFGIYAVAYFSCEAWNWEDDDRKSKGESRTTISDLEKKLSTQATTLTSSQKLVSSFVIDARLNLAS